MGCDLCREAVDRDGGTCAACLDALCLGETTLSEMISLSFGAVRMFEWIEGTTLPIRESAARARRAIEALASGREPPEPDAECIICGRRRVARDGVFGCFRCWTILDFFGENPGILCEQIARDLGTSVGRRGAPGRGKSLRDLRTGMLLAGALWRRARMQDGAAKAPVSRHDLVPDIREVGARLLGRRGRA